LARISIWSLPPSLTVGDVYALIEDGKVRVFLDLRRGDWTGLLDVDVNRLRQVGVELDGNLLQVEDDVRGILGPRRGSKKNSCSTPSIFRR